MQNCSDIDPLSLTSHKALAVAYPTAYPISKLKHEPVSMSMTPYWYMQANTRSDKIAHQWMGYLHAEQLFCLKTIGASC